MKKAMFLLDRAFGYEKEIINKVFSEEAQKTLLESFDMTKTIYYKDEIEENSDVECLFSTWGFPKLTEEEIDRYFPKLKVVFYGAGSVQYFARPFLNKGIKVVSSWMANGVPVAEYTVAQIILANKGFYQSNAKIISKESYKEAKAHSDLFDCNYNINVGILGVGAIGAMVAERLKSYKLNVYAYDPYLSDERAEKLGVKKESLEFIFKNCQTISNHIANIPATVGMLDYNLFFLMKENATFINTGRGVQVKEADLIKALKEYPHRSAVLDVTFPEPPENDSEFYSLKNVFLTPHIAGSMGRERERMGDYAVSEALKYLKNEPLSYEVTLKMLETMA